MDTNNGDKILMKIHGIKQIFYSVNESLSTPGKEILVSMNGRVGYNLEHDVLNFVLRVWYHYADPPVEVVTTEVENVFKILDLQRFIKEDKLALPSVLVIQMVSLSVSHTRGILTQNLAGTVFSNSLMPIIDPVNTAKEFFPGMVEEDDKSQRSNKKRPASKKRP